MSSLKRYFVVPYLLASLAALAHSLWHVLTDETLQLAWLGALLAITPMLAFMLYIGMAGVARTSRHLWPQTVTAMVGAMLSLWGFESTVAVFYATVLGLGGVLIYVFWYSRFQGRETGLLIAGAALPAFELEDVDGNPVTSASFLGQKSLLLFYRGNWCPLCVAQIRELAERYQELNGRGVQLIFVSPQGQQHTREMAERFNIPAQFYIDRDCRAARKLHIADVGGVAAGIKGYGTNTVLPTVLLCDEQGHILYSDQTDNYRVRPEPDEFIKLLDRELVSV